MQQGLAEMSPVETRSLALRAHFRGIRNQSLRIARPLSPEDCQAQSMPDASPIKWHLAHTTWFFATFVLEPLGIDGFARDPRYRVWFNSYYQGVGAAHTRSARGLLVRPRFEEVLAFRA
jgi:hypothetical protein